MQISQSEREEHVRHLAAMLLFDVEKRGDRFTLVRNKDVSRPVWRENLTMEEAEQVLNRWKLRGFHGG
jgi:hypothetical protein